MTTRAASQEVGALSNRNAYTPSLSSQFSFARLMHAGADEVLIREACPADPKFEEFGSMKHGWVIKGDLADPEIAQAVPKAVALISGWLDEHLR